MSKVAWRERAAICALFCGALAPAARAWIYPEHRDIAVAGIAALSSSERDALQRLWTQARTALPNRFCEGITAGDQGMKPACIDFAAWPALAGDHSCSPRHLSRQVVPGDWVLAVAKIAAETKASLAKAQGRVETLNAIAGSNLELQRADPEYATRAGANNAHFLLPRTNSDALAYLKTATAGGAPLNALGLYVQYHLAALAAAADLRANATDAALADKSRDVLALEGFALHWLEDSYAAGHVVGTWGNVAWRKGTHDYYSEFGIDTTDWAGNSIVVFGAAHM
ncbi:MAG TPA: hypothetical protein VG496_02450, partial [Myxococcales bacterium]|nr:hypothetical protein [Myxococcales bacterium]